MNRVFSLKFLAAATFATAALGAATVAEARPDVQLSIGIQSGPVWVAAVRGQTQPQPVYGYRGPGYAQRAPVVVRAPVFVAPHAVFGRPGWRVGDGRFDSQREQAWRHVEQRRHGWHEKTRGGDRQDRDQRGRHHDHRD